MKLYLRDISEDSKELEISGEDEWIQTLIRSLDEKDPDEIQLSVPRPRAARKAKKKDFEGIVRTQKLENVYLITGNISTHFSLICSRCTLEFDYPAEFELIRAFSQDSVLTDDGKSEEIVFLPNNFIDLSEVLLEHLRLTLPLSPLCKQSCKGICQNCGTDLNQGRCACRETNTHNPFSVLKDYTLNSSTRSRVQAKRISKK